MREHPRNKPIAVAITTLLLLVLASVVVVPVSPTVLWGCPFCSPVEGETLLSKVDRAQSIVLGILGGKPSRSAEGARKRQAEFGIVHVVRAGADFDPSAVINAHMTITAEIGSRHLLLLAHDKSATWQRRDITPEQWEFVRGAAQLPAVTEEISVEDRVRRLAFCLPHLVSDDEALSKSAYAEFAAAPYEAVKALAPHLDAKQLKTWISNSERTTAERSLMFALLGVCGTADDAVFLEEAFEVSLENTKSTELASIIAAWLSITGPDGLDKIDRLLLQPEEVSSTRRRAAVEALRFHANVDGTVIDKSRLIESARLLLAHPKAADYVISDLTRWQDWGSLDAIIALRNNHSRQCRWLDAPIRDYLQACPLPAARSALAASHEP